MKTLRYLLLVLVGLLLYLPSLPNKFVWDDEEQVVANEAVHSLAHMGEIFTGSTFNSGGSLRLGGLYYKPLMSASFAVIYTVFGPSPWAFHLFQLSLHIGSTLLLFIIFDKLWKRGWVALIAAMIFLIHPQNVETVVYVSSLQDVLYMFFGMLGLTWIVISDKKLSPLDYGFVGLCMMLALLSKETGIIFSVIIGLYLLLSHKRGEFVVWVGVASLVLASYLYLRLGVAHVYLGRNMFTPMATLPLWIRIGNIPAIVWHYLAQFVWPNHLSISQHWANLAPSSLQYLNLILLIVGYVLVLVWGIIYKASNFVFFWIWFGLGLIFHSQIMPLDMTVADRWFYLPIVGLLGSIGSIKSIKFIKWGGIVILVMLFVRSSIRIQNWRDGLTLYRHDEQIMTASFDLENNLGVELYRLGKVQEAGAYFEKSTTLAPAWWTNWNNLGVVKEDAGRLEEAKADYKKAIDNGGYYLAYGNYARVLIKQEKFSEAKEFVINSLRLYPSNSTLLDLYRYLSILDSK